MEEMNIFQQIEKAEKEYEEAKIMEAAALKRAETAEANLMKAEKEYNLSMAWMKAIEESKRNAEEAKAAEYAKAVEADRKSVV